MEILIHENHISSQLSIVEWLVVTVTVVTDDEFNDH